MKKKFPILLLLVIFTFQNNALALDREARNILDNDSCVRGLTIIQKLVSNLTTFGLFTIYSAAFDMIGAEGNRCNVPTTDVKFSFPEPFPSFGMKTYTLSAGDSGWTLFPMAYFRAANLGDQICVQFITLIGLYATMGCKYRPDPLRNEFSPPNCYVGQACGRNGARYSRSLIPISAMVVQCVKESLDRIFVDQTACNNGPGSSRVNLFPAFQRSMRDAVKAALIIYVVLFGFKIALGSDVPNKGEVFMFFTKFTLVLYFSVGIYTSVDDQGRPHYSDGVTQHIKPAFFNATSALAKLVYDSGGTRGLCYYDRHDYERGYEYLSLWDSIDCRIFHYLGFDLAKVPGMVTGIAGIALIKLILPAFFAFQLLFFIIAIIFAVFFLSVMVYFTHVYIIALIGLTILIYLAPLFVPFALFSATKGYFDSWLKLMFSYTLQPMIITGFVALMLTIFDQVYYENCTFEDHSITILGRTVPNFLLKLPSSDQQRCKDSFGYKFTSIKSDLTENFPAIFFDIVMLRVEVVGKLFKGLLTLTLFSVLFYHFVDMLTGFAADLTGGNAIGGAAVGPKEVFDRAKNAVSAVIKAKMGDKKGAAKDAKKAVGGDKGKGRGGGSGASISKGKDEGGGGKGGGDSGGGDTGSKVSENVPGK